MSYTSLRPEIQKNEPIHGVAPVSSSLRLRSSAEEVFEVLDEPGHLERFHPYCRNNYSTSWERNDRQDVLTYLNGLTYVRDFISWRRHAGFDLLIGEVGQRQSLVGWRLEQIGSSASELTITVYPHLLQGLPAIASSPLHRLWLKPKLESYLESVVQGLQCHLVTQAKTPKNAFGSHPWFS